MPNSDPRDGFFYPTLTILIDSYNSCLFSVMPDLNFFKLLLLLPLLVLCDDVGIDPKGYLVYCPCMGRYYRPPDKSICSKTSKI